MTRSRAFARAPVLALLVLAAAAAAGCAGDGDVACPEGTDRFVEYQLFMGRSGEDGEVVDDAAWEDFLAEVVTPRFPDGLTVLDARGQWRDSTGLIQKERSKLLVILAPSGDEAPRLVDEVTGEYKRRFDQEAVVQVVADACVSFS